MGRYHLDLTNLRNIESEIKKRYIAQVGVLGDADRMKTILNKKGKYTASKTDSSSQTNASIGLRHEYGVISKNLPERSFLRMPLYLKLPNIVLKLGQKVLDGLTKKNIKLVYRKIGLLGEGIVMGAFATRGYGRWANLKSGAPSHLIKSGQLHQSIHSRVVSA